MTTREKLAELCRANVEVFYMSTAQILSCGKDSFWYDEELRTYLEPGYYAWICPSGYLPQTEPVFLSEFRNGEIAAINEAYNIFIEQE